MARRVSGWAGRTCAICRLRHAELLDAAPILADTHPLGTSVVLTGLALCSIHHRAFDEDVLGVRPDLVVTVRRDVPQRPEWRLDRYRLEERSDQFRTATGTA